MYVNLLAQGAFSAVSRQQSLSMNIIFLIILININFELSSGHLHQTNNLVNFSSSFIEKSLILNPNDNVVCFVNFHGELYSGVLEVTLAALEKKLPKFSLIIVDGALVKDFGQQGIRKCGLILITLHSVKMVIIFDYYYI